MVERGIYLSAGPHELRRPRQAIARVPQGRRRGRRAARCSRVSARPNRRSPSRGGLEQHARGSEAISEAMASTKSRRHRHGAQPRRARHAGPATRPSSACSAPSSACQGLRRLGAQSAGGGAAWSCRASPKRSSRRPSASWSRSPPSSPTTTSWAACARRRPRRRDGAASLLSAVAEAPKGKIAVAGGAGFGERRRRADDRRHQRHAARRHHARACSSSSW